METTAGDRLKIGSLLLESARIYLDRWRLFCGVLALAAVAVSATALGILSFVLEFSVEGATLDPRTFLVQLTNAEWLVLGAGVLVCFVVISLAMGATVHAAAGASGIRRAFGALTSRSMQIFWLQCVVYTLAMRFSPWAGLLLWVVAGFAVPVALREDLGPGAATDRAWTLSEGNRVRILGLELGAVVSMVVVALAAAWTLAAPGPRENVAAIAPPVRAAILWFVVAVLLIPLQFGFVAMTRAYLRLAPGEAALHAGAASSVTS